MKYIILFLFLIGSIQAQPTLANSDDITAAKDRANHTGTQDWDTLTATPTTLAGYGITDAAPTAANVAAAAGYINVKAAPYNAIGDGVTDDTAAIQAALDAAEIGFTTVHVPAGTYKLTAELVIKGEGVTVIGNGPYTTIFDQTTLSENAISIEVGGVTRGSQIRRIGLAGVGAATSTGTAINARDPAGGLYGSGLLIDDCRIEGFANGIWAQHMPKLVCRDSVFENNVVGARLQKADTFLFSNVSMGAASVVAETWAYVCEVAASAPATGNFGGVIDIGEYGDMDHFLLVNGGTVTVRQPNLERIDGSYVVRASSGSNIVWDSGRINNTAGTSAQAVFSLNCDAADVPKLSLLGHINLGASGWRQVEAYGTFYYNVSVQSMMQRFPLVLTNGGAGGTAVTSTTVNQFVTRRTDAAVFSGSSYNGVVTYLNPDDSAATAAALLVSAKDPAGTYKRRNLINDSLLKVPAATVVPAGNVSTTATKIYEGSFAAYAMHTAGWSTTIRAFGKFADNTNAKQIVVKALDSITLFDTTSLALQNSSWEVEITIFARYSYSPASPGFGSIAMVKFITDDTISVKKIEVTPVVNLGYATANTFQIYATGGATNDVVMYGQKSEILKNGSEY